MPSTNPPYLDQLTALVGDLLQDPAVTETIRGLKREAGRSDEPFVWSVLEPPTLPGHLPGKLESGWIFVLREGVPSGCHFHPNSVQHMIMVEGRGESEVAGRSKEMLPFGSPGRSPEEIWYVIPEGVEHEFFPEGQHMVVVSFHTCRAHELEEIACGSGASRRYERDG